jgi:hypothetical protein
MEIIALTGAGLAWTNSVYPYHAPLGQYESIYSEDRLPSRKDARPLISEWKKQLYVRARSGRLYAGLTVQFNAGATWYQFTGHLNPAGSPILEPDPAKLITDEAEIRRLDEATRR